MKATSHSGGWRFQLRRVRAEHRIRLWRQRGSVQRPFTKHVGGSTENSPEMWEMKPWMQLPFGPPRCPLPTQRCPAPAHLQLTELGSERSLSPETPGSSSTEPAEPLLLLGRMQSASLLQRHRTKPGDLRGAAEGSGAQLHFNAAEATGPWGEGRSWELAG